MKTLGKMFIGIVIVIIIYTLATQSGPLFTEKKSVHVGTVEISHTTSMTFDEKLQEVKDNVMDIFEKE